MVFVSTSKRSVKAVGCGEYEKFAGVNFTIFVFSIFNASCWA
jgi:hypothetical protein